MRKVTLFIAMSLDGFIADKEGNVDWLGGEVPSSEDMSSYVEFAKGIDTVVMGWKTYHQIVTELSPGEWMYKDLMSYILTHRELPSEENVRFVNRDVCGLIRELRRETGKDIWICGGPGVIQPLIEADLIDRFHISIIPTLVGNGVRLFGAFETEKKLRLVGTRNYNGITDVIYEPR